MEYFYDANEPEVYEEDQGTRRQDDYDENVDDFEPGDFEDELGDLVENSYLE